MPTPQVIGPDTKKWCAGCSLCTGCRLCPGYIESAGLAGFTSLVGLW
jgi:hypothetical protein